MDQIMHTGPDHSIVFDPELVALRLGQIDCLCDPLKKMHCTVECHEGAVHSLVKFTLSVINWEE